MSDKKIAFFATSMSAGGAERVSLNLAKGFANRGYSVDLILASFKGEYIQSIPDNVNVIDLGESRVLMGIPKLMRYLKQEKPAVMYCAESDRGFSGTMAKLLSMSRTRIMIGIHTVESLIYPGELPRKYKWIRRLERLVFPFASKIIPVSKGVADDTVKNLHVSRDKVQVIYNPVVTERLKQDMYKPVDHKWFQDKSIPVVLAVGRLVSLKGFDVLLRAFKVVVSQCEARLIILGEGNQRNMLTSLIQELDIADSVDMPGFVDNPYAYMKNADLLVLSSKFEGFGNVLAEAMACGCPVVSTDCPSGPAEILNNGEYGKLVPVGDAEALGQAIIEALQQDYDISQLQKRAEDFSEDKIIGEYEALFWS